MSRYRYQILWKAEGIKSSERRTDIDYSSRKYTYSYNRREIFLKFTPNNITLSFEAKSKLKEKSLQNTVSDVIEKIFIIYTVIYCYGLEIKSAEAILEEYNETEKQWI